MLSAEYLAGLFDGEGYFTMHGRNDGYVMCYIGIVMHDRRILDKLLVQFPKSVIYGHDKNNRLSSNVGNSWRLNSRQAKEFVDMIYPYLIIKQEDLDWYYRWLALARNTTTKLTEEMKMQRNALVDEYKLWRASKKA